MDMTVRTMKEKHMSRKLLESDFDGTLCHRYTPDCYPATAEVLQAISSFRAQGGLFGVVTGRDWRWSWYELDHNGKLEFDYIIALNGAQIYDRAGNTVREATADGAADVGGTHLARALAERCWELVGDYFSVVVGQTRYHFSAHLPEGGEEDGDVYSPHTLLDTIGAFHMAGAVGPHGLDASEPAKLIAAEFGAHINALPNGRCIDMPPAGIDKGESIAAYAASVGVSVDDIWTAGDNYNDIAMLQAFHGCAMANGVQAAKDAAEAVCRDLTEVIALICVSDKEND